MNANKKFLKVLILSFLVLVPINIKGYTVNQGSANYINGQLYDYKKYIDGDLVFCTQFEVDAPSSCSTANSVSSEVLEKRDLAGIGAIIKWYNDTTSIDSSVRYVCASKLITKFMYNYVSTSGRENYALSGTTWVNACGESSVNAAYESAIAAHTMVDRLNKKIITYKKSGDNVDNLEFTASGNKYVATVNIRTKSSSSGSFDDKYPISCQVTTDNADVSVSKNNGYYTAKVTANKNKSDQKIEIRCRPTYTFKAPEIYYTGCNGQDVISRPRVDVTKYGEWQKISGKFKVPKDEPSKGSITVTKTNSVTGMAISGIGFTLYNGNDCSGTVARSQQLTDRFGEITFSELNAGNYSVKETYYPSDQYETPTPTSICKNVTVTDGSDTPVSFTNTPKTGLVLIKENSNNDPLAQLGSEGQVRFKLYTKSGCSENDIVKIGDQALVFGPNEPITTGIRGGTYYLQETETKKGYHLPKPGEQWNCTPIRLTAGIMNEIKVVNQTECEYQFDGSMTMKERIDLYNNLYEAYSQKFNALLNLDNKTATDACKNIPITRNYDKSCFGSTSTITNSSDFSGTNLSMFTEKYGSYTFCLTTYNMKNNLGKSAFLNIKSGQSIINTDNSVATAILKRTCYNFGDQINYSEFQENFNYQNYVEDDASITINVSDEDKKINLINSENKTGGITGASGGWPLTISSIITVDYRLQQMYSSNKDGRLYYGQGTCPNDENCKYLGRGIISNFNMIPGKIYNLNFDIVLNNDYFGELDESSDCTYSINDDLFNENELQLEFRTIDTSNPFAGKNGNTRNTNSNWCDKLNNNCSGDYTKNNIVKTTVIDSNNSYNKTGDGAKYVIELTPGDIQKIRQENKGKEYDNYDFTCISDGEICISNYLTTLRDRGVVTTLINDKREKVE